MGSYTFKWEHPAEEVYVTGTFDNWTKSVKLDKKDGVFEKKVDLKDASDKIYYKFVVDNNWTLNESSPKEADKEGNTNNFLTPNDIALAGVLPAITNVGAGSSTANMAGAQPLEKDLNKSVGINPLPASGDAKNPIQLKPGEKVPQHLAAADINQNVKLDKESYENSDALTGGAAGGAAISNVGPGATTAALAGQVPLEPKSGATKTPDATSGDDDKKKKKKNKKKNKKKKNANGGATAGDNKDDEDDKDDGEAEEEKSSGAGTAAAIAGGATAVGGVAVAAAVAAAHTASEAAAPVLDKAAPQIDSAKAAATKAANDNLPDSVKEKLPTSAQEILAGNNEKPSSEVPAEVQESQKEAGVSPEASASATAVEEKKAVEAELLKEVKKEDSGEVADKQASAADATPAAAVPAAAETGGVALPLTDKTSDTLPTETKGAAVSDDKDTATSGSALPLTSDEPAANQGSSSSTAAAAAPAAAVVGGTAVVGGAAAIAASKDTESKPAPAIATDAPTTKAAPSSTAAAIESKPVESTPPAASAIESKPVEAKPIATKPAESTPAVAHPPVSKPAEAAPVVASPAEAQTTKAAESKPVAAVPAAAKPVEAAKSAAAKPVDAAKTTAAKVENKIDSSANGSGSKPAGSSSKPADSSAAGESRPDTAASELKKKKNRLSSIFSKIKSKLSDKN